MRGLGTGGHAVRAIVAMAAVLLIAAQPAAAAMRPGELDTAATTALSPTAAAPAINFTT